MTLRDTRLLVDLDALEWNLAQVGSLLAETGLPAERLPRLACVLKADAYGLGSRRVAKTLIGKGVDLLAVACLPEALELRRHFADLDLLVMGHTPSHQYGEVVKHRVICTIFDEVQADALSKLALGAGMKARVHIKIDSGMNRLGIKTGKGAIETLERIASKPGQIGRAHV